MTTSTPARFACARAVLALAALALAPALAHAQSATDQAQPRAPRARYALPEPTYRGPDAEDLIYGNGKLHFSGGWRHWGDSRNNGELVQMLLAPSTVARHGLSPNGLPESRFCSDNPDRC